MKIIKWDGTYYNFLFNKKARRYLISVLFIEQQLN